MGCVYLSHYIICPLTTCYHRIHKKRPKLTLSALGFIVMFLPLTEEYNINIKNVNFE